MCTLLIAWHCLDDADFVVAANRDELLARPAAAPGRLSQSPPILGGRDLLGGGTWLAVTPDGRLAAVTNRRGEGQDEVARDRSRRSRGDLPMRLLPTAEGGERAAMEQIRPSDYNPFNLLVLTPGCALVGHGEHRERLEVVSLAPGMHVLCVHDLDDANHAKERRIRDRLDRMVRGARAAGDHAAAMTALLGDHDTGGGDPRDAVCIHGDVYGTVSASSVIAAGGRTVSYRHAPGRPCATDFVEVRM